MACTHKIRIYELRGHYVAWCVLCDSPLTSGTSSLQLIERMIEFGLIRPDLTANWDENTSESSPEMDTARRWPIVVHPEG